MDRIQISLRALRAQANALASELGLGTLDVLALLAAVTNYNVDVLSDSKVEKPRLTITVEELKANFGQRLEKQADRVEDMAQATWKRAQDRLGMMRDQGKVLVFDPVTGKSFEIADSTKVRRVRDEAQLKIDETGAPYYAQSDVEEVPISNCKSMERVRILYPDGGWPVDVQVLEVAGE